MTALNKLFVYGTLLPGRSNEHWLKNIGGTFTPATLKGVLIPQGWGAALGYPAVIPHNMGEPVAGMVFASDDLPDHWGALDDFEGDGYERTQVSVQLDDGSCDSAWVYALKVNDDEKQALIDANLSSDI